MLTGGVECVQLMIHRTNTRLDRDDICEVTTLSIGRKMTVRLNELIIATAFYLQSSSGYAAKQFV